MISMDVTHSPFLRETCIDSGVSILNFGMARNLFSELKPMTGLQQLLGFGTRKAPQTVLGVHNFDCAFLQQVLNTGPQGILLVKACVTAHYAGYPG